MSELDPFAGGRWRSSVLLSSRGTACSGCGRLNDEANAVVFALFQDAGFAVVDLGDLATGGAMQQVHHPRAGLNLIRLKQ